MSLLFLELHLMKKKLWIKSLMVSQIILQGKGESFPKQRYIYHLSRTSWKTAQFWGIPSNKNTRALILPSHYKSHKSHKQELAPIQHHELATIIQFSSLICFNQCRAYIICHKEVVHLLDHILVTLKFVEFRVASQKGALP